MRPSNRPQDARSTATVEAGRSAGSPTNSSTTSQPYTVTMVTRPMRYPAVKELTPEECWARLRTTTVGRLALGTEDFPELFPMNYAIDHASIVFRTDPGTKVAAALDRARVAFEADGMLPETEEAWSVVIKGNLEPLVETMAHVEAEKLPLYPWQFGEKAFFMRLQPVEMSGRQFVMVERSHWHSD